MTINADLSGHTALITGAGGLLGFEHSFALLKAGCRVIMTDNCEESLRKNHTRLKDFDLDKKVISLNLDVTSEESIINVQKFLLNKNININILINNAAIDPKVSNDNNNKELTRLENFSLANWNRELEVGLTGAFLCSKIFGSQMNNMGIKGNIINIASDLSVIAPLQSLYSKPDLPKEKQPVKPITYSVIKTGLIGLTRYLATYWANSGIRCNALSPGGIFNEQPERFVGKLSSQIPLGRMAKKDEYHAALLFLCSPDSEYMNGHNLIIDGGRSVW